MKKANLLFILLPLLVSFSLCIGHNDNIDSLDIHISNGTNQTFSINLKLFNSKDNEIVNKTFTIKSGEQIDFKDLTKEVDNYKLIIMLNDGRTKISDNISVNEFRHTVSVHIDYDDIKISQKLE